MTRRKKCRRLALFAGCTTIFRARWHLARKGFVIFFISANAQSRSPSSCPARHPRFPAKKTNRPRQRCYPEHSSSLALLHLPFVRISFSPGPAAGAAGGSGLFWTLLCLTLSSEQFFSAGQRSLSALGGSRALFVRRPHVKRDNPSALAHLRL